MNRDLMVVIGLCAALVFFTGWWAFGYSSGVSRPDSNYPIVVMVKNGLYEPAKIQVPANKSITLHFVREDSSNCASAVSFPQFDNKTYNLPMYQTVEVILPPLKHGEIEFTCATNLFKGKLIVI